MGTRRCLPSPSVCPGPLTGKAENASGRSWERDAADCFPAHPGTVSRQRGRLRGAGTVRQPRRGQCRHLAPGNSGGRAGEDLEIAALHCALSAALLESGDVAMDRIVIELVRLVRRRRAGRTDTGLGTAAPAGRALPLTAPVPPPRTKSCNWCPTPLNSTAASSTPSLTRRENRLPLAT